MNVIKYCRSRIYIKYRVAPPEIQEDRSNYGRYMLTDFDPNTQEFKRFFPAANNQDGPTQFYDTFPGYEFRHEGQGTNEITTYTKPIFKVVVDAESNEVKQIIAVSLSEYIHLDCLFAKKYCYYDHLFDLAEWNDDSMRKMIAACDYYLNKRLRPNHYAAGVALKHELVQLNIPNASAQQVFTVCMNAVNRLIVEDNVDYMGDYYALLTSLLEFFETTRGLSLIDEGSQNAIANLRARNNIQRSFVKFIIPFNNTFANYFYWLIGHNFNERAMAVRDSIMRNPESDVQSAILENQMQVLRARRAADVTTVPPAGVISNRWTLFPPADAPRKRLPVAEEGFYGVLQKGNARLARFNQ